MSRVVIFMSFLLLVACGGGSETQQLQSTLNAIAQRPGGEIEPLPTFEPYESFTYSAASMRSPFDLPMVARDDEGEAPEMVQPDLDRNPEPLEAFGLNNLEMVGVMSRGTALMALVRDEAGRIHRVSPGHYMGRNHGQVNRVTRDRIELTEIVPSGDGGWVERPRTVGLSN